MATPVLKTTFWAFPAARAAALAVLTTEIILVPVAHRRDQTATPVLEMATRRNQCRLALQMPMLTIPATGIRDRQVTHLLIHPGLEQVAAICRHLQAQAQEVRARAAPRVQPLAATAAVLQALLRDVIRQARQALIVWIGVLQTPKSAAARELIYFADRRWIVTPYLPAKDQVAAVRAAATMGAAEARAAGARVAEVQAAEISPLRENLTMTFEPTGPEI